MFVWAVTRAHGQIERERETYTQLLQIYFFKTQSYLYALCEIGFAVKGKCSVCHASDSSSSLPATAAHRQRQHHRHHYYLPTIPMGTVKSEEMNAARYWAVTVKQYVDDKR